MERFLRTRFLILILGLNSTLCAQQTVLQNYYNTPAPLPGVPNMPGQSLPAQSFPSFNTPSPTFPSFNSTIEGAAPIPPANVASNPPYFQQPRPLLPSQQSLQAAAPAPGFFPNQQPGNILQQVYPQPAQPAPLSNAALQPTAPPVQMFQPLVQTLPYQNIAQPQSWLPGFAMIHEGRWVVNDYFFNMPPAFNVKVLLVKPHDKEIPVSEKMIERQVASLFEQANISLMPFINPCKPLLPTFQVILMAYPCERRYVGVVSIQLFEEAQPKRVDTELNGVWMAITWERQTLIVGSVDDFADEVLQYVTQVTQDFINRYNYYLPAQTRPCFETEKRNSYSPRVE